MVSPISRYVVLTVVILLAFSGCGKGCGKKEGGVGVQSFALIPSDNNVVVGLDWKKLSASPFGDKMQKNVPPEALPLLKEISGVLLALNVDGMKKDAKNFVAVVSGKLDSAALVAQMTEQVKKDGGTVQNQEYEGYKIYSSSKEPQVGLTFVEGKGVVGNVEAVKKVIDLSKNKGDSIEKNQAVMDLIKSVDQNKMLWAVGLIPEGATPPGAASNPADPMSSFSGLKAMDLSVDYIGDLTLDLGIIAKEEAQAQQVMTMANSYKALFGASLGQKDPSVGKVFEGLNIIQTGNRVVISLKLDKATVDEISKKAEQPPAPAAGSGSDTVPSPGPDAAPSGI